MTFRSRGETACALSVAAHWRGEPLPPARQLDFTLEHAGALVVTLDAPLWSEPPPSSAPGRVSELWRSSVAELFIWGGEDRYLELELGPYGHWWLLELQTWRQRCREDLRCEVSVERGAERWQARVTLQREILPPRPWRLSACAIWGLPPQREYAMSQPTLGERPDFHQASAFFPAW